MNLHPTIVEADGKPAFVVLPYAEYVEITRAYFTPARAAAGLDTQGSNDRMRDDMVTAIGC